MKPKTENKKHNRKKFLVVTLLTLLVILPNKESGAETGRQDDKKLITGQVSDKDTGKPLPGVAILVKDQTAGTISGPDGNYQLEIADKESTLVYSFPGYEKQEVAVSDQSTIDIELKKADGVPHILIEKENEKSGEVQIRSSDGERKPIYIVDEKEVKSIDHILPESIESITILKDESAVELYGERAKDGVILIKTKR
ncbi:carboxypeptidase-like regulatory domain-containing protein [Gaoshiqia sp. Z1-71]|uniref:carboxypeptidase-like regulatory domain-containing protein n=1 Tax=Gaoshiqia hydrogeniformans TaxID=3290090 RepID=UPI003BF83E8B